MTGVVAGLGRVLGLQFVARLTAGLPPRTARALLVVTVLVVNGAPLVAVLTGVIGFGDVWLWLAVEVVTIYVWTVVRGVVAAGRPTLEHFGLLFFTLHYGGFALVPFFVGLATVLPVAPLRSPVFSVLVLGGVGFLAVGWSMAGRLRAAEPNTVVDYLRAYARMALAYAALFLPLVGGPGGDGLTRLSDSHQRWLAVLTVLAKAALELVLVVAIEHRADGRWFLFGRPVVVRVTRVDR